MEEFSRLEGALRELEEPLGRAICNYLRPRLSPETVLTTSVCGDASNILRVALGRLGFETIQMRRFGPNHVLLHTSEQVIDPTYPQFFAGVGVTDRLCTMDSIYPEVLQLLPERRIALFGLDQADDFGSNMADIALELRCPAKRLIKSIEPGSFAQRTRTGREKAF